MDQRSNLFNFFVVIAKKVTPKFIFDYFKVKYYTFKTNKSVLDFELSKKKYIDYYKTYIDEKAHKLKFPAKVIKTGNYDLELLKKLKLKKNNTLFEFGVGFFRSTKHFVEFLDTGKFVGNDTSSKRIEFGKKKFPIIGKKKATLIATNDNSFDWLKGKKFDFLYSYAVFCHMPVKDIEEVLKNAYKKAMHKNSKFLFSYSVLEFHHYKNYEGLENNECSEKAKKYFTKKDLVHIYNIILKSQKKDFAQVGFCNWFHSRSYIENLVSGLGFKFKDVTDYLSDNAKKHYMFWDRVLLITK